MAQDGEESDDGCRVEPAETPLKFPVGLEGRPRGPVASHHTDRSVAIPPIFNHSGNTEGSLSAWTA